MFLWIEKLLIERKGAQMLTKLWGALDGSKTYLLASLGIVVALAGHFWGPFNLGALSVPAMGWSDVWTVVWQSGLFSALRSGVAKTV